MIIIRGRNSSLEVPSEILGMGDSNPFLGFITAIWGHWLCREYISKAKEWVFLGLEASGNISIPFGSDKYLGGQGRSQDMSKRTRVVGMCRTQILTANFGS